MTYSILFTTKKLQMVLWEMGGLALLLAFLFPWLGGNLFGKIERFGLAVARNRRRAILAAALFPMVARLLMLPFFPPPKPVIHDEFSYLVQGDTFAHGRVANPTPPMSDHFESEYVLMRPNYASQYQPLPGLFLALGQVVVHNPWFGVWLATGLMCGCLCWALMETLPPAWALFGSFAAALQFGIFGFWMNSYFGGSAAAVGGALVFGGVARMRRAKGSQLVSAGTISAVGIVVLMASRPFEGLIWSSIAVVVAGLLIRRVRIPLSTIAKSIGVASLVLAAGALSLTWYDAKVTGDPLTPPYLEYRNTYGTPQSYWWQPPVIVTQFANAQLKENFDDQFKKWQQRSSLPALAESTRIRLRDFWRFFIGPLYTPALFFLGAVALYDRRIRWALFASVPFVLDHATYHAWYPQQTGPATILIVLLLVQCWRHMRVWMRRRRVGFALSRNLTAALASAVFLAALGRAAEPAFPHMPVRMRTWPSIWEMLYQPKKLRDDITAKLKDIPGKHLLLIKYSANHRLDDEWVFNSADIESQRIIYARSTTPESDAALSRHFGEHDVWVLEPDVRPYLLARIGSSTQFAQLFDRNLDSGQ